MSYLVILVFTLHQHVPFTSFAVQIVLFGPPRSNQVRPAFPDKIFRFWKSVELSPATICNGTAAPFQFRSIMISMSEVGHVWTENHRTKWWKLPPWRRAVTRPPWIFPAKWHINSPKKNRSGWRQEFSFGLCVRSPTGINYNAPPAIHWFRNPQKNINKGKNYTYSRYTSFHHTNLAIISYQSPGPLGLPWGSPGAPLGLPWGSVQPCDAQLIFGQLQLLTTRSHDISVLGWNSWEKLHINSHYNIYVI